MEACFHFLLQWRKITINPDHEWLSNYLNLFNAYIHPEVEFGKLDMLEFCTLNIEKSSREKLSFELPPFFQSKYPNDLAEVIMVFWKRSKKLYYISRYFGIFPFLDSFHNMLFIFLYSKVGFGLGVFKDF